MQSVIIEQLQQSLNKMNIPYRRNEKLSRYTTFRIGGPCTFLIAPRDSKQVISVLLLLNGLERILECPSKHTVIGNGSNILAPDEGYDGVVIWLSRNFSQLTLTNNNCILATAGTPLLQVCHFAQLHGLSGLEFAYGIPGTVGGAVYMNAGAYGGEMKDVVVRTTHTDYEGKVSNLQRKDFDFGYRHSVYTDHPDWTILSVLIKLTPDDPAKIKETMNDYMSRRQAKQPLEYPSAGSTFKRPEGAYAGALIEQCGLKGLRVGGAEVSQKHAGFVINVDHATARDVRQLVRKVAETVEKETGYELEPELLFLR